MVGAWRAGRADYRRPGAALWPAKTRVVRRRGMIISGTGLRPVIDLG